MSMIIGIIIRILMSAKKHKNLIVIGLIIYAVSPNLIVQISSLIGELPVFSDLVAKLQVYLFDAGVINFNSLLHMVLLIYFIVVYYALVKKRKQENLEITNLYKALEIVLLFTIWSFNYWDIFLRWSDISIILFTLCLMDNTKIIKIKGNPNILIVFVIFIAFFYIQYANLKGLNISKNLDEYCYKNIISVFDDKEGKI